MSWARLLMLSLKEVVRIEIDEASDQDPLKNEPQICSKVASHFILGGLTLSVSHLRCRHSGPACFDDVFVIHKNCCISHNHNVYVSGWSAAECKLVRE